MTEIAKLDIKLNELEEKLFHLRMKNNWTIAALEYGGVLESQIIETKIKIRKLKENKKRIGVDI